MSIYLGSTELSMSGVDSVYFGNTKVWGSVSMVEIPTLLGSYTYNQTQQTAQFNNYDSTKMAIGGVYQATNAGNYTATFTLNSGLVWTDGTTEVKNISWSIAKAQSSITPSTSSTIRLFGKPGDTTSFTYTYVGDGTITASVVPFPPGEYNNISISGSSSPITITLTGQNNNNPNTYVTLTHSNGTNYEDSVVDVRVYAVSGIPCNITLNASSRNPATNAYVSSLTTIYDETISNINTATATPYYVMPSVSDGIKVIVNKTSSYYYTNYIYVNGETVASGRNQITYSYAPPINGTVNIELLSPALGGNKIYITTS